MLIRGLASVGRWDGSTFIKRKGAKYSGDALADIRTTNNALSVWCATSVDEEKDAVVALCLNRTRLDKFVYVQLSEQELNQQGITFLPEPGKSDDVIDPKVLDLHRNLVDIDYNLLGTISSIIHLKVTANQHVTKTKKDVASFIYEAILHGKVRYNNENKVITESYDILGKEKPCVDSVPLEEQLEQKCADINQLKIQITEKEVRINKMLIIEEQAKNSNLLKRLQFCCKVLLHKF